MTLTDDDEYVDWRRPGGIFVLAPISGAAADAVRQLQHHYDSKLATAYPPHVTVAGSSGVGPIRPGTTTDEIRRCLTPVADATPALSLPFGPPQRFMQTNVVSLPLSPHGPLRVLHDLIARSGLAFAAARFTFTPHVTLNLYRSLTPEAGRALLAVRILEPAILDRLLVSATDDVGPPRTLLELPFAATAPA
jgi:2'-5' RNA ligase